MEDKKVIKSKIRRDFFKMIGAGAAGAAIFSFIPFKLFSKEKAIVKKEAKNKIAVNIHPLAVKRNNKG